MNTSVCDVLCSHLLQSSCSSFHPCVWPEARIVSYSNVVDRSPRGVLSLWRGKLPVWRYGILFSFSDIQTEIRIPRQKTQLKAQWNYTSTICHRMNNGNRIAPCVALWFALSTTVKERDRGQGQRGWEIEKENGKEWKRKIPCRCVPTKCWVWGGGSNGSLPNPEGATPLLIIHW